jgi:hypothetical protein
MTDQEKDRAGNTADDPNGGNGAPEDQIQGKPSQAEGERDGRSTETGQGNADQNRTGDMRGDRTGEDQ